MSKAVPIGHSFQRLTGWPLEGIIEFNQLQYALDYIEQNKDIVYEGQLIYIYNSRTPEEKEDGIRNPWPQYFYVTENKELEPVCCCSLEAIKKLISLLKKANYSSDMTSKLYEIEKELLWDVTKPEVDPEYEIVIRVFWPKENYNEYFYEYDGIEIEGANVIWTEFEYSGEEVAYTTYPYEGKLCNLTTVTISLDAFPTRVKFKDGNLGQSLIYSVEKMCNMSNITSMEAMFDSCYEFKYIRDPNWDTSNVRNMKEMFYACHQLEGLDVSNWNTSRVTDMSYMFSHCKIIKNKEDIIGLDDLDFSSVKTIEGMFTGCYGLDSFTFNNWNTYSLENTSKMFNNCIRTFIDMNTLNTSKVKNMNQMFYNCGAKQIYCNEIDTSSLEDTTQMFNGSHIEEIDVSNWNVKNIITTNSMFYNCTKLKTIKLFDLNGSNLQDASCMICKCPVLTTLDGDLTNLVLNNLSMAEGAFADISLKEIDLSNLYAPKLDRIAAMFAGSSFETIKLANVQMYPVTDDDGYLVLDRLFSGCIYLKNLDLTNCFIKFRQGYDTSSHIYAGVFYRCNELVWDNIIFGEYHEYHKGILKWYYDTSISN